VAGRGLAQIEASFERQAQNSYFEVRAHIDLLELGFRVGKGLYSLDYRACLLEDSSFTVDCITN
jgi:hypothetical protein